MNADYERRARLARASDAWLREAETDEGVSEKTRQEYMDAYTAVVDANDAHLFAALDRTAQYDGPEIEYPVVLPAQVPKNVRRYRAARNDGSPAERTDG